MPMYGCVCTHKYKNPKVYKEDSGYYRVEMPENSNQNSIFPCSMEVIQVLVDKINELQSQIERPPNA